MLLDLVDVLGKLPSPHRKMILVEVGIDAWHVAAGHDLRRELVPSRMIGDAALTRLGVIGCRFVVKARRLRRAGSISGLCASVRSVANLSVTIVAEKTSGKRKAQTYPTRSKGISVLY